MRMAPPPTEVEKAEAQITDAGKSNTPAYRLIPSKVAVQQAKELNMELSNSDIPVSSSLYFQFACITVEFFTTLPLNNRLVWFVNSYSSLIDWLLEGQRGPSYLYS